ncbi:GrxA family glutaredoxin [bacterium SCSIO 12696]|nr:GrxA family glutaredoxin [bacterium SCSIO 12696]
MSTDSTRYTIFGHQACGFCRQAKAVMEQKDLPYRYVDIHEEGISKEDLSKTIGHTVNTVPQIFYGTEYIGGFDALQKHLAA